MPTLPHQAPGLLQQAAANGHAPDGSCSHCCCYCCCCSNSSTPLSRTCMARCELQAFQPTKLPAQA
jgi:hypothetical protein